MEDIEGVAVRVVIIGKVSRREVPLTILGLRQYTCPDRCLPLSVTTIRGLHKLGLPTGLAFHIYFPCSPTFAAHYPGPDTTGSMANPSSTTLTPPRSSILPASSLCRPYTVNHVDPITMVRGRVSPECLFFHPTIPPSHHSAIPPSHHSANPPRIRLLQPYLGLLRRPHNVAAPYEYWCSQTRYDEKGNAFLPRSLTPYSSLLFQTSLRYRRAPH